MEDSPHLSAAQSLTMRLTAPIRRILRAFPTVSPPPAIQTISPPLELKRFTDALPSILAAGEVRILEREYEETENAYFIWRAISLLEDAGLEREEWIDRYLKAAAADIVAGAASGAPPKDFALQALGLASSQGTKKRAQYQQRQRDFDLACRVSSLLDGELRGTKGAKACAVVAQETGESLSTVKRAWATMRERIHEPLF